MNGLVNYMMEANIGLLVLLAFYKLFLHRETSFRGVRLFMMVGILASVTLPTKNISRHLSLKLLWWDTLLNKE